LIPSVSDSHPPFLHPLLRQYPFPTFQPQTQHSGTQFITFSPFHDPLYFTTHRLFLLTFSIVSSPIPNSPITTLLVSGIVA
ncbi:unnamed protein product, partial [Aphanomyces euteiches]